jgi:hypothetical protein
MLRTLKKLVRAALPGLPSEASDAPAEAKWLPSSRLRDDDVFLVSYPKSGNTWVRFLLANLMRKPNHPDVDFHTIHRYVPEVGTGADRFEGLPSLRIFKSHAPFVAAYPRVIYIVRDGRDVYTSYYHYRLEGLPEGITFAEYLARDDHWPTTWGRHVESWREGMADRPDQLLMVRYEDLLADAETELARMTRFLGLHASDEAIAASVAASRFESMRRIEKEKGRRFAKKVSRFVRKGHRGDWRAHFDTEAQAAFRDHDREMLVRLGYRDDFSAA